MWVVQMINGNGVSVQARSHVQLIGWQNTWEQAPGVPPPLHRPNGGGQPWPCTWAHGPKKSSQSMSANCGASTVTALSRRSPAPVVKRQACEQQCPASTLQLWDLDRLLHVCTRKRGATVGSKPSSQRLHLRNLLDLHNQHQPPCQCTATGESQWSLNSETMGTCLCAPTGMLTTLKRNCNCGTSTVMYLWIRA